MAEKGTYKNVETFLRNADDIMIRTPLGDLVPASSVQWVPAKGELGDVVVTLPKSLATADIPPNVAKFLTAAGKKTPTEITPQMRKIAKEYNIPIRPKTTPEELAIEIRDTFAPVDVVAGTPLKVSEAGAGGGIQNLQLPKSVSEIIVGSTEAQRETLAPRVLNPLRQMLGEETADDVARGLEAIHAMEPEKTLVLGRKGGRTVVGFLEGETTEGFVPTRVTDEALAVLRRADAGESLAQAGYGIKNLRRVAEENGIATLGKKKAQILEELRGRAGVEAGATTIETVKTPATTTVRRIVLDDEAMKGMGISERVGEILNLKGGQRRLVKVPNKGLNRVTPQDFERVGRSGVSGTGRMPIDQHTMMVFQTRKGAALAPEEIEELAELRSVLRRDLTKEQKSRLTALIRKEGAVTTTEIQSRFASEKARLASSLRARAGGFRRNVEPKPGTKAHDKWKQSRTDQHNDRVRLAVLDTYGDVTPDRQLSAELMEEIADNKASIEAIDEAIEHTFIPIPRGAGHAAFEEDLKEALIAERNIDELDAALKRDAQAMQVHMKDIEHDIASLSKKESEKGLNFSDERLFAAIQKQKEFYQQLGLHKPLATERLEGIFANLGIRHILGSAQGYVPLPLTPKTHFFDMLAKTHLYQDVTEPRLLDMASRYWGTLENAKLVAATDFGPIVNGIGDIARATLGKPLMSRSKAITEWSARRYTGRNLSLDKFVKRLEVVPPTFKPTKAQLGEGTVAEAWAKTTEGQFRNSVARVLKFLEAKFGAGKADEARRALYESHFNIYTLLEDPNWFKPTKAVRGWLTKYVDKMAEWNSAADLEKISPNVFEKTFRQILDERALGVLGKGKFGEVSRPRIRERDFEGTMREFFTWVFESSPRRRLGGLLGNRPVEEYLSPAAQVFYARPFAIGEGIASKSFIKWSKQLGVKVDMKMFGLDLAEKQPAVTKLTAAETKEFGSLLRHLDIPGPGQTPLGSLDEFFGQVTRNKLILDLTFLTVQGNLATIAKTTSNPQGVLKMWKSLLQVTHSDASYVDWLTTNAPRLAMYNNVGSSVGMSSVAGGQFRKDWFLEHMPLLGKPVFGNFREWNDRMFERGLMVLKTNMVDDLLGDIQMFTKLPSETQSLWAKRIPFFADLENTLGGLVRKKSPLENLEGVVKLIDNIGTGMRPPITNNRAALERALLLVPNFFRASLEWHVKALQPWTLEGFFAARMLLKNYAFWSLTGKLFSTAMGEGDKFNVDKPWRADFLGVRLPGGQYIPVFPSRAVQTITARLLKGAFDRDPKQVGYWVETFLEGRASPIASSAWESLRGEDFLGRKHQTIWDRMWAWGKQLFPIWIEQVADSSMEAFVHGNPRYSEDTGKAMLQIFQEGGIEATGRGVNPPSPVEELGFIIKKAVKEGKIQPSSDKIPEWYDLEQADQELLLHEYPEAQKWADIQDYNRRSRATDQETRNTEEFEAIRGARKWAFTRALDEPFEAANVTLAEGQYTFADVEKLWREQIISGDDFREFMEDTENAGRGEARAAKARLARDGIDLDEDQTDEIAEKVAGDRASTVFGIALLEYNDIQPSDVVKTVVVGNREITLVDWEGFEEAREDVLAKYPEDVRERVVDWVRRLERDIPVIGERRAAGDQITQWFQIPHYASLTTKQGEFVDIMRREIGERYNAARDRMPIELSREESAQLRSAVTIRMVRAGQYNSDQKRLAVVALMMENSSTLAKSLENPARISYILENPGLLLWYDFLFGEVPRELRNLLPPEVQSRYDEETLEQASEAMSGEGLEFR
jgi:hypothetical protein